MRDYKLELNKQKETLESQGYKVAYMVIYGSQNYGLELFTEDYQSDIDMKAVIVPTLDDLIHNSKPISTTIETEWGQCDLKDIRIFFDKGILKANPVYVETLYTDYYIIDDLFEKEFNYIRNNADQLVYCLQHQMIRAMYGMMMEKKKALCHPYPTIKHKIDKFGYDGKQLHHIYRIWLMMEDYFVDLQPIGKCLTNFSEVEKNILMDFKLNKVSLEKALEMSKTYSTLAKDLKESVIEHSCENENDYSVRDEFKELSKEIIRKKIVEEVIKGWINKN